MDKAASIIRRLKNNYPDSKTALRFDNPIQMLVATILSAQCTDTMVNKVSGKLFKKYKTVYDFSKADQNLLEAEIRPTGFYRNKAKNIISTAKIINERFNGIVPKRIEDILTLPGVGRKTANIVLWNSYGIVVGVAVDTHVQRVVFRLGLTKNKVPEKIEQDLMRIYPKKEWPQITNLLISHGRKICIARKPLCRECFLYRLCEKQGVDRKFWD